MKIKRPNLSIHTRNMSLSAWAVCAVVGSVLMPAAFAQDAGPQPKSMLGQAAATVGVKQCQAALDRLGSIGTFGSSQQDILLDWDKQKPDGHPVFAMLGANFPNGAVAVSVSAIPDAQGQGCSVLAERISLAPFTCESIAQAELPNQKATALLPRFNVYTDPNDPDSTVSLMDSPPGCLIIRRYVKYHWLAPK